MFWKSVLTVITVSLLSFNTFAETVLLKGESITDVNVFESDTRYYIEYPDGSTQSYPKSDDIVVGEENIRKMDEAKAAAAALTQEEAEAAAAAAEEKRKALAKLQRAGAATTKLENDLEINALVIARGGVTVVFASLDIAFVEEALTSAVAAKLAEFGSEITRESLVLAATGVNTALYLGVAQNRISEVLLHKFDEAVFENAASQIADTIWQAENNMVEAVLQIAESDAPSFHKVRENTSPTPDSMLGVIYASAKSDNAPIACLLNYALVPTIKVDVNINVAEGRGDVGILAAALREKIGADTPVLFFNGAAGDLQPSEDANIAELASVIMAAKDNAPVIEAAQLSVSAQKQKLPATLMAGVMPEEAMLQEIRINNAAMITIPAALASQWGQLLRAKAAHQNLEHLFVLTHAGDFTGYNPAVDEFINASDYVRLAFYGPLTGLFYAQHYMDPLDDVDLATWVPPVNDNIEVYKKGLERGATDAQLILETWNGNSEKLNGLVNMLDKMDIPDEVKGIIKNLSQDELRIVGKQLLSIFVRGEFSPYSKEQLIQLFGVAQGANVPFDAVFLVQLLSEPKKIPNPQISGIIQLLQFTGIDFLS